MRSVPSYIETRLKKNIQTRSTNSAPSASLWVSRPSTLTNDAYLERQTVTTGSITDVSIAVCHPRAGRTNSDVYLGYVSDGVAKVVTSKLGMGMVGTGWRDTGFRENATAVAVAFDGTMPRTYGSQIEFITEKTPWIFWVDDGALYAKKLGEEATILAESNCADVSATRASWTQANMFDHGLVVFFILGGYLYYRQLIRDEWSDAELVSFGPSNARWSAVTAFRTWDYRVGVQVKSTDGDIYELFTQFEGIGTRNVEHFQMLGAKSSSEITKITHHTAANENEHFCITNAYDAALYGGCYEIGDIEAVEAWNSDDGTGDWGKHLNVRFTREINLYQVREQESCFEVTDSIGNVFWPTSIFADYTGRVLTFDFMSFNNAIGDITISYTPGTVCGMFDNTLPAFSFTVTPKNLVPVEGLPKVIRAWNSEVYGASIADGQCVNIQFDQKLYGNLISNSSKFTVYVEQYVYSTYPDGTPVQVAVPFIEMCWHPEIENTIQFKFGSGNANSLQKCAGNIIVEYRGGSLYGDSGPLLSFVESFTPVGIAYRGDASDGEHFTIANALVGSDLTEIHYSSYSASGEHFKMEGASYRGTLTHIDNI